MRMTFPFEDRCRPGIDSLERMRTREELEIQVRNGTTELADARQYVADGSFRGVFGPGGGRSARGVYNRSLIEASLDPLVTIDALGKDYGRECCTEEVTGFFTRCALGTWIFRLFHGGRKRRGPATCRHFGGLVKNYALEIRHRDGHVTPVLYNAAVYHDEAGTVIGVFAAARDITERKRAEEALKNPRRDPEPL